MKHLTAFLAASVLLLAACKDNPASPPAIAPTVTSVSPLDLATGVARAGSITATFSAAMNPTTLTGTSFVVMNGSTAVPGTVTLVGSTATFVPTDSLAANTNFTASITTAATNTAGTALDSAKTWSFTTALAVAPTVQSTGPLSNAVGVVRNTTVTAVFSVAMNPATLTTTTFTLANGASAVTGVTSYTGTTAKFIPAAALTPNTLYTATITTGATSAEGTPLAVIKTWTFTTVNGSVTGPATVNLGTAGNYVILAKTGVSTTGATTVVGDIGLSPAAASFITGFGLSAPPTTFSTSGLVTGSVWASDYDPPTPTVLTTAVSDMQTAYTDAAGRTLPDFTELGAGNIDGLTLVPGLYKWGTGVSFANGVTLNGGPNDIWIFQVAQDLTVGNGAIVTLSGGAQAKNVFWQVAGQATLGTTSSFQGNILCQTLIAFNTGTMMTGRALAQTAVTLNATAIVKP